MIAPARRAALRLPDKPLADIGGAPMIVCVLRRAAQSGATKVIAAVDDDAVAAVVKNAGFDYCLTGECDSGSARVAQAARQCDISNDAIVVNVQGDEPFIEPEIISGVAKLLVARRDCVCATAARPICDNEEFYNPACVKVVADADNTARYFSRAPIPYPRNTMAKNPQDNAPLAARIHIGVYAYTMRFLSRFLTLAPSPYESIENLEQLRILWHGESIALLHCDSISFGIDTPEDLAKARQLAAMR